MKYEIYFDYRLKSHGDSIQYYICDNDDFEIESISTNKKNGNLIERTKNVDTTLFESASDFIQKYPEAYNFVIELDKEIRWSCLIDIIEPCLPKKINLIHATTATWIYEIKRNMKENELSLDFDVDPYYRLQETISEKVILENQLPDKVNFIAGADVAYNDKEKKMVGVIVVLDAITLSVVDSASYYMDITFPYIPGLFSFREIPPLIEAYKKLKIKPDIIVCDGQGIAHPKGIGMATHLGIELNLPTIGCAKKRLIGAFNTADLLSERGNFQNLIWNDKIVGVALRTQNAVNPMFVSIGHKIDLQASIKWVLYLCKQYRLPETTRQADQIVNKLINRSEDLNLFSDPEK